MKKKSIFIVILLLLITLLTGNAVQATGEVITPEAAREMGSGAIGKDVMIGLSYMKNSNFVYCIKKGQANPSGDHDYRILVYMKIEHGEVDGVDANGASWHLGYDIRSSILAEIISGPYGEFGYKDSNGNPTPRQKALWEYFEKWRSEVASGVLASTWSTGVSAGGGDIIDSATRNVENGSDPSAELWLLWDFSGGGTYQSLLLVKPGPGTGSAKIKKVDGTTRQPLSGAAFKLINIQDRSIVYETETTGEDGTVELIGIPRGWYEIIETKVPSGYNTAVGSIVDRRCIYEGTTTEITIVNRRDTTTSGEGEGIVILKGNVWEYAYGGKAGEALSGKSSLKGIRVTWYSKNGAELGKAITKADGSYEITGSVKIPFGNWSGENHDDKYSLATIKATDAYKMYQSSYVEFGYNGIMYTTIKNSATVGPDNSIAIENEESRSALDGKYTDVIGVTNSNNTSQSSGGNLSYTISGRTATVNFGETLLDAHIVTADTNGFSTTLLDHATTKNDGVRYCAGAHCDQHGYHGHTHYSGTNNDHSYTEYFDCSYSTDDKEYPNTWIIENMNLGLVRREQPDLALESDIDNVVVIMKGQEYTYIYGNRGEPTSANIAKMTFSNDRLTYSRPINPADVKYVNESNHSVKDLEIYVTYRIMAYNQSNSLTNIVGEVTNYYDSSRYELAKEHSQSSDGWEESSSYGHSYSGGGYKAYYNASNQVQLQAQTGQELYKITYKVKDSVIKSFNDTKAEELFNVSEISVYSTRYGANTVCAEQIVGRYAGKEYAGIDLDSCPLNANPTSEGTFEDDTDFAPVFKLTYDEDKVISGTVWEDTDSNTKDNQRTGDSKYDNKKEKTVDNVKVELLTTDGNIAKIYPEKDNYKSQDAVTYTKNGNYEFRGIPIDEYIVRFTYGNDTDQNNNDASDSVDKNTLQNATTIDGKTFINARNYKSTVISPENSTVYNVMKGNGDLEWHLHAKDGYSVAVDNLEKRKAISNLQYNNFDTPVNMTAYTRPFKVQVEYDTVDKEATVPESGESGITHNWTTFDFSIIERAREDIVINKTIENIRITLANGQILTEGNPNGGNKLNYVKALGIKSPILSRKEFEKAQDKLLSIEMDSELIQGATLDITYAITVKNNSEEDYEYDYQYQYSKNITTDNKANYYYYGEITTPLVKPSTELVVDYMDSELICTTEDTVNKNWTKTSAKELFDNGLISQESKDVLEKGNYLIFTTEVFKNLATGEQHTEQIHASKLLANQADEYVYDNHVEILELNGKIARNIDSVNKGEQVTKTYKMGDYLPSLDRVRMAGQTKTSIANNIITVSDPLVSLHEQDDDMITIRITPPTGLDSNIIIYIVTAALALIVIAGGVFIIKKRVL